MSTTSVSYSAERTYSLLSESLPPGFLPFEIFSRDFSLGGTSTEKPHPGTVNLSQTMHRNVSEGMKLLLDADQKVLEGLKQFIPALAEWVPKLKARLEHGGRIFLVGAGSSGRVAVDLAAKCKNGSVIGTIAGGDSAMIAAREGFEDSENEGKEALKNYSIQPIDTVVLISGSGSSSFNVGCGHFVADRGAQVLYFYNSKTIPTRTEELFKRIRNPAIPLELDIGPQAIAGSTRLQAATLAECCLGVLLGSLFLSEDYPEKLLKNMEEGLKEIASHLETTALFAEAERDVFSDTRSNFRQLTDVSEQGYVTFLTHGNVIREVLIDATETSPTFSTQTINRENERGKKRAEFRAYMVSEDNQEAWNALIGRQVDPQDANLYLLAHQAKGDHSFDKRPTGKGNLTIGVVKTDGGPLPEEFLQILQAQEGKVGLIVLSSGAKPANLPEGDLHLVYENVPQDSFGITQTVLLKQTLNLISNSSMVLMNKVLGNQMIDVLASNNKLIDRVLRMVKYYSRENSLSDEELYHLITHVQAKKKAREADGIYTPSIVKMVLTMLSNKKGVDHFEEISRELLANQELVDA